MTDSDSVRGSSRAVRRKQEQDEELQLGQHGFRGDSQ